MLAVTALSQQDADLCPIRQVLSQVTGKWQILIVLSLEDSTLRFGELKRTVGDITQRVLTENLRKLERDGYLTRTVHPGPPLAVSYALTDLGMELMGVLKTLTQWAASRHDQVVQSRQKFQAQ